MEGLEKTQAAYVERLWEWMKGQGFNLTLEEVQKLHERNFAWYVEQAYVVVVNYKGHFTPVRHIVEVKEPYSEDNFKRWYYKEYHKLDGDEFIFCPSHSHMFAFVKAVEEKRKVK